MLLIALIYIGQRCTKTKKLSMFFPAARGRGRSFGGGRGGPPGRGGPGGGGGFRRY